MATFFNQDKFSILQEDRMGSCDRFSFDLQVGIREAHTLLVKHCRMLHKHYRNRNVVLTLYRGIEPIKVVNTQWLSTRAECLPEYQRHA